MSQKIKDIAVAIEQSELDVPYLAHYLIQNEIVGGDWCSDCHRLSGEPMQPTSHKPGCEVAAALRFIELYKQEQT